MTGWKGYPYTLEFLFLLIFLISWGGVRLSPLGTSATVWPIVPAPDDDDECGGVGEMTGGENLPQFQFVHHIIYGLTRARTMAAAVGSQRIELWHGPPPPDLPDCWICAVVIGLEICRWDGQIRLVIILIMKLFGFRNPTRRYLILFTWGGLIGVLIRHLSQRTEENNKILVNCSVKHELRNSESAIGYWTRRLTVAAEHVDC
jgi:hypothetical protein